MSKKNQLDDEALNHFQKRFKDLGRSIHYKSNIQNYPRFFSNLEDQKIVDPNTLEEVKKVLNGFAKEKIPGPDGQTIVLFLDFFDIMGVELVAMVEESRI